MIKITLIEGATGERGNYLRPYLYFKYEYGVTYYGWFDDEALLEESMMPKAEGKEKTLRDRIIFWVRTGQVKEINVLED